MSSESTDEGFRSVGAYRKLLIGLFYVGGASVAGILFSLVRSKTLALTQGPTGVASASLWLSFVATGAALGGLGVGVAGSREVSVARSGTGVRTVRLQLRRYTWVLALAAGSVVALGSPFWAWLAGGQLPATLIALLAIPVGATILTQGFTAELRGAHEIRIVAVVRVAGAVLATACAVTAILSAGRDGLFFYVAAVPVGTATFAWFYAKRTLGPPEDETGPTTKATVRALLHLGVPAMSNGVLTSIAALSVRVLIDERAGSVALGLFAAAFALASQHIGLILQAMSADYLPRLAAVIHEPDDANELVNRQTRLLLTLGVPATLLLLAGGQWLLALLYSAEFVAGLDLLHLFLLATLFRMVEWPLGYVLLARGDGWLLTLKEAVIHSTFVGYVYFFLGDDITAVAHGFLLSQAINVVLLLVLVRFSMGHRPSTWTIRAIVLATLICGATVALAHWMPGWPSPVLALAGALIAGSLGARDIIAMFRGRLEKRKSNTSKRARNEPSS